MTLTEFLLARIAEDEALARTAYGHRVNARTGQPGRWEQGVGMSSEVMGPAESVAGAKNAAAAAHIARHDPAHVLAVCAAHRRIMELHTGDQHPDPRWHDEICLGCQNELPCPTLRHLAAIWRDHDEWREEWSA